jgi:hypothetical protein
MNCGSKTKNDFTLFSIKCIATQQSFVIHCVTMSHNFKLFPIQFSRHAFTSLFCVLPHHHDVEYRKCICGYNNKIVNLRSHVIKVPTRKKNVVEGETKRIHCNNVELCNVKYPCDASFQLSFSLSLYLALNHILVHIKKVLY